MSRPYATPEAICLRCGRSAKPTRPTLDPTHPMVLCSMPTRKGRDLGCGVTLGTLDIPEGIEVARWNVSMRQRAAHLRHLAEGVARTGCQLCAVDQPTATRGAHPFRSMDDRFGLFVHLDIHHGDRGVLVGMHRRTITELQETHAMHHGEPYRP